MFLNQNLFTTNGSGRRQTAFVVNGSMGNDSWGRQTIFKPNGDWLAVRYNDTENNVALWEFHSGIRRPVKFSDRAKPFMLDRNAWHELKVTVNGTDFKAWLDGALALEVG